VGHLSSSWVGRLDLVVLSALSTLAADLVVLEVHVGLLEGLLVLLGVGLRVLVGLVVRIFLVVLP